MNQGTSYRMDNFFRDKSNNLLDIYKEKRKEILVSIIGYCLMPNHFHLILHENTTGGISKFMAKLLTAYSMYFNKKYQRSGPLFTRPFRSEHINKESQFVYIFSYVHLNPLSLLDKNWKEEGIKDNLEAKIFLDKYKFSSYSDFLKKDRPEGFILDQSLIPEYIKNIELSFNTQMVEK